jgi:hypothetical protein
MNHPVAFLYRPPYGLSFQIDDLQLVHQWCEKRGLEMDVALDQMFDDLEFEELLIIAPPSREKRSFTMWSTLGGIVVQTPTGVPHTFPSVADALDSLRPMRPKRRSLLQRLRLAS